MSQNMKEGVPLPEQMFAEARLKADDLFKNRINQLKEILGDNPQALILISEAEQAYQTVFVSTHYRWVADNQPQSQSSETFTAPPITKSVPPTEQRITQTQTGIQEEPNSVDTTQDQLIFYREMVKKLEAHHKPRDPYGTRVDKQPVPEGLSIAQEIRLLKERFNKLRGFTLKDRKFEKDLLGDLVDPFDDIELPKIIETDNSPIAVHTTEINPPSTSQANEETFVEKIKKSQQIPPGLLYSFRSTPPSSLLESYKNLLSTEKNPSSKQALQDWIDLIQAIVDKPDDFPEAQKIIQTKKSGGNPFDIK